MAERTAVTIMFVCSICYAKLVQLLTDLNFTFYDPSFCLTYAILLSFSYGHTTNSVA